MRPVTGSSYERSECLCNADTFVTAALDSPQDRAWLAKVGQMQLKSLWSEAVLNGWAAGPLKHRLEIEANLCGWIPVATRDGDQKESVLRPKDQGQAHPHSISAVHGLGEQPLHVDGSHMFRPPDVVVLVSETTSSTPTNLWRFPGTEASRHFDCLSNGLFVVGSGRFAFLSPALEETNGGRKLRFDPTIMEPADARALKAAQYLGAAQANPFAFHWTDPSSVLVINNRAVLHGRAALAPGDLDRKLTRHAFYLQERP